MAHSLLHAKESGLFEAVAVSSDSLEILDVGREYGADYIIKRPAVMAADNAPKIPVIMHCVQEAEKLSGTFFSVTVDLDATSPLRFPEDIHGAVRLLEERGVSNVISGTPARRSPYFNLVELDEHGIVKLSKLPEFPIARRQDAPKCYDLNASVYVWRREALFSRPSLFNNDTLLYVMPEDRSIDIDSELDFEIVEFLLKKRGKGGG